MPKVKKGKKLHLEMTRRNVEILKNAVDVFNRNPERITPEIKIDHIINEALNSYLIKREY